MKILAPLSSVNHYESLIEAGADEFYCGIIPFAWLKKYGVWQPINRREFMNSSNMVTYNSLKILAKKVAKIGVPVRIAFNALYYTEKQYDEIFEIMKRLISYGFKTFIIADIALVLYLREKNLECKIHLSGEMPTINHQAIQFWQDYKIAGYIFPRKTSLASMQSCIKNNPIDVDYEAFVLNENCAYVGAFCNTFHCDEMHSACFIPTKTVNFKKLNRSMRGLYKFLKIMDYRRVGMKRERSEYQFGNHGCGICYIKELKEIGITHLKIVGRGAVLNDLVKDIQSINELVQSLATGDFTDSLSRLKAEYYKQGCPHQKLFCYYPQEKL